MTTAQMIMTNFVYGKRLDSLTPHIKKAGLKISLVSGKWFEIVDESNVRLMTIAIDESCRVESWHFTRGITKGGRMYVANALSGE